MNAEERGFFLFFISEISVFQRPNELCTVERRIFDFLCGLRGMNLTIAPIHQTAVCDHAQCIKGVPLTK
jgi:hypothetical protein